MVAGVFVGLTTIDVIHAVDRFPKSNSKVVAHSQQTYIGGPAANASITFSFLGGTGALVTAIGTNPIAMLIRSECQTYSIQTIDLTPSSNSAPPISSIVVDRSGLRNIVSVNARASDSLYIDSDKSLLQGASALMVDGHHMEVCQAWAAAANRSGDIHTVLDAGSWKPGTADLLRHINTAICSNDFRPPGCLTNSDVFEYLKDMGVQNIAITNGPEAIPFVSMAESGTIEPPAVDSIDSSCAGDVLHGAFCYYLAAGRPFANALSMAVSVASECCRFHGPREWMSYFRQPSAARLSVDPPATHESVGCQP
jgi:sugar/nucleoside kinase (ribokinase family)